MPLEHRVVINCEKCSQFCMSFLTTLLVQDLTLIDEGRTFLRNVVKRIPRDAAPYTRKTESSHPILLIDNLMYLMKCF